MPKNDRDNKSPLIGWLIAASIIMAVGLTIGIYSHQLSPKYPQLSGDVGSRSAENRYQPQSRKCDPARLERLTGGQRLEDAESCAESRENHLLNIGNLIEYRRAADAANASAVLSYENARITIAGGVFGIVTMGAAIAAAVFAWRAAHHTKRSADISEDSTRPFVGTLQTSFKVTGAKAVFVITFKNGGDNQAVNVFCEMICQFEKFPLLFPIIHMPKVKTSAGVLIPNATFQATTTMELSDNELSDFLNGIICVVAHGELRYQASKHSRPFHTYFSYCAGDGSIITDPHQSTMHITAEGNDAS